MNAINGFLTVLFDLVLKPLEALGSEMALTIVSGVFGVLALVAFKYISWQKGIKATKDRIKGHMIEIRLYQDDLVLVSKAIGKVLLRNFQYLFLNFGPFIPLAIPFAFVVAQMVVRYAFDPVEVNRTPIEQLHAGEGTTIRIDLVGEFQDRAGELELVLPEGLEAVSPLVPVKGIVAQEFVARQAGEYDIVIRLGVRSTSRSSTPMTLTASPSVRARCSPNGSPDSSTPFSGRRRTPSPRARASLA